ncbi:regulatory protein, luxR family [Paractinoplanes atraurantiacus]|uniref:Regulatory protein, luxR family n=1 Tax=Paractinoplanes atraurantiacus TaxID=1036182 RepID=A0A285KER0_9ACTN|nr:regulatory protein, luxR family [Actinoplanes atraurantiacus]
MLPGPVDARVRDRIVAEAGGNPLALRELPRGLNPADLASGFGAYGGAGPSGGSAAHPRGEPVAERVETSFRRRVEELPERTRKVLLVAAGLLDEVDAVTQATGASVYQLSRLSLAAYRAPLADALALFDEKSRDAAERGDGRLHALTGLGRAILHNGHGDHRAAMAAAQDMASYRDLALHHWALRELVEAAAHAGEPQVAAGACAEARAQLRAASEGFTAMGATAFAERAAREVAATGETVRSRKTDGRDALTPQEATIAQLAEAGRTGTEIAAALFLSPRTVEGHRLTPGAHRGPGFARALTSPGPARPRSAPTTPAGTASRRWDCPAPRDRRPGPDR